jgi:alpha-beta hydrolase superfamily lysophospholipase
MPTPVLLAGYHTCCLVSKKDGEELPSKTLEKLAFGSYNNGFNHPRTASDWINRDTREVDTYIADPWCGFTASAGLYRDMMGGIRYNQAQKNLHKMNKALPVHFIAGGDDPVGNCGKGVRKAAEAFRKSGMEKVSCRIYPLCRHEILREINKEEIFEDITQWLNEVLS